MTKNQIESGLIYMNPRTEEKNSINNKLEVLLSLLTLKIQPMRQGLSP